MRGFFFFLFLIVPLIHAAKYTMEIKRRSKLEEQLKAGNFSLHVAAKNQMRAMTSSQPFTDYYDNYYLGSVIIGTAFYPRNEQQFNMLMDTGSANVWVIRSSCTSGGCDYFSNDFIRTKYASTASSTYLYTGRSFQYSYSYTVDLNGYLGADRFIFGGLRVNQTFGMAAYINSDFGYEPLDGVFGLAFPIIGDFRVVPPIQNILPHLSQPIFTIFMGREMDFLVGRITYGDLDSDNCGSTVVNAPLTRAAFWQFKLNQVSIGSYTYNIQNRMEAISDSGTSWIIAPTAAFNGIIGQVNALFDTKDQTYWVPCSNVDNLPTLYINVNGQDLDIPPQEYTLNYNKGDNKCWLTFDQMDSNGFSEPSWVLGDTFIRSWCQTYDIGNQRMGFSVALRRPRKNSGQLTNILYVFALTLLKLVF